MARPPFLAKLEGLPAVLTAALPTLGRRRLTALGLKKPACYVGLNGYVTTEGVALALLGPSSLRTDQVGAVGPVLLFGPGLTLTAAE